MRMSGFLVVLVLVAVSPWPASAQKIYFTDTEADEIWVANKDGSGSPSLLHSNACGAFGPVALLVVRPTTGQVVYTAGNYYEIWTAPVDGSGSPSLLWSDTGNEHLGVTIDPSTGTLYWTTRYTGEIRSGALDGSGGIDVVFSLPTGTGDPIGITFDGSRNRLCWTSINPKEIQCGNADGSSSPSTLFPTSNVARQIVYDPSTDRLFWTEHSGTGDGNGWGDIVGANADGSGGTDELYSVGGGATYPFGIDVDPGTGLLYWTEADNDGDDVIMVAPSDGSGTPTVLFSGPWARLRGIAAGVNIVYDVPLFADGFESSDTARWSATVP